jgi:hypothetical protein
MSISAMKQALEALCYWQGENSNHTEQYAAYHVLHTAIKQAEKEEPVGYFSLNDYGNWEENVSNYGTPLYTTPLKREWVGLAAGEAREFYESDLSREELIHKIDEFLQEKNT